MKNYARERNASLLGHCRAQLILCKKLFTYVMMALAIATFSACTEDDPALDEPGMETPGGTTTPGEPNTPDNPDTPDDPDDPNKPSTDGKTIVAYFSWGGTTQRMAQQIAEQTGAELFRIERETPYPTDYTETTEVAQEEKNSNARPPMKQMIDSETWANYDTVFIGCPVWWWTTPMIICTFAESYDFKGKTVVPFCTYASTYRNETLARIAELTPDANHLEGLGLTSGQINQERVSTWLEEIGLIK